MPPSSRAVRAWSALEQEGVAVTTPLETEPWGGRYFQITDPNGVVVQFVR